MRLGIYGGSFDPIHFGHLILAEQCREQAALDQIWFVPAALAPHKQGGTALTDRQRIDLIELALAGHPALICSDIELNRGGVSFTVTSLAEIHERRPEDELFLLMGADSLAQFHTWREPEKICQLATPLVVDRPGSKPVDLDAFRPFVSEQQLANIKSLAIDSPLIDISSSDIRARVASHRTIRFLLPRAAEKYIEAQKLFQRAEVNRG